METLQVDRVITLRWSSDSQWPETFRPQTQIKERKFSHSGSQFFVLFHQKKATSNRLLTTTYFYPLFDFNFVTMGSVDPTPSFEVLRDTRPDDTSLPAFMVSTTRGFLPRQNPIVGLPKEFDVLESILTRMPIKTLDGTPGLLGTFTFGETVLSELPDLTHEIEKYRDNLPLMNALYRDYSFLASAYLLEPCHERFTKGEGYGLGRQTLPSVIALPISRCAEL